MLPNPYESKYSQKLPTVGQKMTMKLKIVKIEGGKAPRSQVVFS